MKKSYSIAEARNRFTALLREAENASVIEITRHGKPVAVLIPWREFQRLTAKKGFWDSYRGFRDQFDLTDLAIEPEIFSDARDRSTGREANL